MAATEATLYEVRRGTAWITLNRSNNRNALSRVLVNELFDHLGTAQADDRVRGCRHHRYRPSALGRRLIRMCCKLSWTAPSRSSPPSTGQPSPAASACWVTQAGAGRGRGLHGPGIKIVSNAGGLNPKGMAAKVEKVLAELALAPRWPTSTETVWRTHREIRRVAGAGVISGQNTYRLHALTQTSVGYRTKVPPSRIPKATSQFRGALVQRNRPKMTHLH